MNDTFRIGDAVLILYPFKAPYCLGTIKQWRGWRFNSIRSESEHRAYQDKIVHEFLKTFRKDSKHSKRMSKKAFAI